MIIKMIMGDEDGRRGSQQHASLAHVYIGLEHMGQE
jgi:hypothetical protein